MDRRTLVGTALALSIAVLQPSSGPACRAQAEPKSDAKAPAKQRAGKAADDRPKREWEFGKFGSMRNWLVVSGPASLLAAPAVQEELGLSEKQKEKLAALEEDQVRMNMERLLQFKRNGDEGAMGRGVVAARLVKWRALDEILSKKQKRRLLETGLQTEGMLAAVWPEVQAELNASPSQEEAFAAIASYLWDGLKAYNKSIREAIHGADPRHPKAGSREEAQERIARDPALFDRLYDDFEAKRDRAAREVARLLTRRQKAQLKKMMGEPYDVSDLQRPGGGNCRPEEARRYWEEREEREAQKAGGAGTGKEKDAPGDRPAGATKR